MKFLQGLKLLVDLRKGWKSKTVVMNRIMVLLAGLDVGFFSGEIGGKFVDAVMWLAPHIWLMPTREQAISFLVGVGACGYQWLRMNTTTPVEGK